MAQKNELHGKCGAGILYFTNGVMFVLGLVTIIYGCLVKGRVFEHLNTPKLTMVLPDNAENYLIVAGAIIAAFAFFGLFGTICMRKAAMKMVTYQEENPQDEDAKKKDAHCCSTLLLAIYIILIFISFILFLVGGSVFAVMHSTALKGSTLESFANTNVQKFDREVTTFVNKNANSTVWTDFETTFECCGWHDYANNKTVAESSCAKVNSTVPTCNDKFYSEMAKNVVPIYAVLFTCMFICLVCFICALVVRCAIHKEKSRKETESEYHREKSTF